MKHILNKECTEDCLAILLEWREQREENISVLSVKRASLCQYYNFNNREERAQLEQESIRLTNLLNKDFAVLKKINLRIEEFENGTFSYDCPKCKEKIAQADLKENPLMVLCRECQKKINNHQ